MKLLYVSISRTQNLKEILISVLCLLSIKYRDCVTVFRLLDDVAGDGEWLAVRRSLPADVEGSSHADLRRVVACVARAAQAYSYQA